MKYLYNILVSLFLILVIGVFLVLLLVDTSTLVDFIIGWGGLEAKRDAVTSLITKMPMGAVYLVLSLVASLGVFALYKQKLILQILSKCLCYIKEAIVNLFRSLTIPEILLVTAIPFISSLYFAATIPVSYDEAITYNYFTAKPFYYCMIFYPYPNNHVLHSLLTNLTEYTPFVSALFAIRIPAILSSLFTCLIGYSFLKKFYTSRVALLVVGFSSAMYMSIYYSVMSRGYSFIVLAFVVCMYAAFNIIHKGSRNKDWMFFTIAGVLGCYSIPSFLYAFATLNVLILIYNYKNIKQQFIFNTIAGVLVILLYLPIMIVDGIAALTSNQFVQSVDRLFIIKNVVFFYRGMFADIAGIPQFLLLLLIIPIGLTIIQKDKQHLVLWLVFISAPFVLLLLHAVNPFYRTFLYYNFILAFLVVVPFKVYLEKVPKYAIIVFILLVQGIGVYSFSQNIGANEGFNTNVARVVDAYFNKKNRICFPCIASENYKFEAKVKGLEDQIIFLENEKANVDTISGYDFVILEESRDLTMHKKPYTRFESQLIYKDR